MSAEVSRSGLTLRRVVITSQGDGRFFASLLFLSKMKSDERTIGPFNTLDEVMELVRRIKFAVETLGKRASEAR